MLALDGLAAMDGFLEDNQFRFPLNPTFLYCIAARIHQLYPDYHRGFDFTLVPTDQPSHLMRFAVFVQKLKTLKVSRLSQILPPSSFLLSFGLFHDFSV